MNIFLLGNGFDLHHDFPTAYINFLNTVKFLKGNYNDSIKTIGDVFGNETLQTIDLVIKRCYQKHSSIYDDIVLEKENIQSLIDNAYKNKWFKYFSDCFNKDIGWIDFEQEIARVIDAFRSFFTNARGHFSMDGDKLFFDLSKYPKDNEDRYIIQYFDFFYEISNTTPNIFRLEKAIMKSEYIYDYPLGAKSFHFNDERIVSQLHVELMQFSQLLKEYIKIFIDSPALEMKSRGIVPHCASYPSAQHVLTFNYTKTYQLFYNNANVHHIHGDISTNIILGVNPDNFDNIGDLDTTFVKFKKYYQRIFHKLDRGYITKKQALKNTNKADVGNVLYVIGHSLDETDKDVIKDLFEISRNIFVLYHDEIALGRYITNLIKIYGKDEFDNLRVAKKLEFLPQAKMEWKGYEV